MFVVVEKHIFIPSVCDTVIGKQVATCEILLLHNKHDTLIDFFKLIFVRCKIDFCE